MQEVASIWTDELAVAATRPFRESPNGDGDIENAFLVTHQRIERWREAMLWTWAVAKMGHREGGKWGSQARREIEQLFGSLEGTVKVVRGERQTLHDELVSANFVRAGWDGPRRTNYKFCELCRDQGR
jgi:3-O-alpha-D-mannopyranosyl-alpha-D-mannopyranose xylosylphosphotransferase